jgi:hypothetical protein
MPAKSKAQQRFMGMVHAAQKGELDNPSAEVEKAADSMSDADAKDYASTKHTGLPNHVKKENMESELKEIIRQTYRESLRESINEDAAELPQATIPSSVKIKLQMAIDKIKDSKLSNNAKLQLVAQVVDALDVDKSQLSTIANKIRSKMESVVSEVKYPTNLYVNSVIYGQGFTGLKGIEGGKYYKVVEMDDTTATLVPCDEKGKIKGSKKVRHKLSSLEGGIATAKRGDENGIVIESVNEGKTYSNKFAAWFTGTVLNNVKHPTYGKHQLTADQIEKASGDYKDKLFKAIETAVKNGDITPDIIKKNESVVNETISHEAMGIASMTNTRKEAVQKFIDDNDLNALEILKVVTKGGLYERVRFIQALVGTPNNSSFKWYVKTYANESVNESIDINHWKKYANGGGPLFSRKITTQSEFNTEFREVAYGYNNDPDSRENKLKRDKIEKVKKLAQEFFDKEGFITSNIIDEMWSAMVSGKIKEGKVNEGKKVFKINPGIGSSKYSISSHDGVKKHKDGSDFYDIEIFKNKVDLEKGIKKYSSNGFIQESLIKEDVYKSILSDNKGKMFFSIVDADTKDVKFLDAKTWIQSTIKDKASDSSKELVLTAMAKQINQFNKKVDFNMWVNANKPTWEEKIKYLLDKGLVKNVNRGGIKVH